MNILIIKQTSLGDVLHSTMAPVILKENYPDCKITYLVDKSAYNIIRYNDKVDKIIQFDLKLLQKEWKKNFVKVIKHILSVLKEVRKEKYDLAFDLQGLFRSVFFLYLSKANKKFVKGRWILLKGFRNKKLHALEEIKQVLLLANLKINTLKTEVYTSELEETKITKLINKINPNNKKMLLISPFSRWDSKDWGIGNYKKLLKLIKEDIIIVFTGSIDRRNDVESIIDTDRNIINGNVYNLVGKVNLLEFVELIRRGDLLLSGDGFPVHVASAVNTNVIALFGPTDEKRVGPTSSTSIILRDNINCSRCYKKSCPHKRCMDNISPHLVHKHISNMI